MRLLQTIKVSFFSVEGSVFLQEFEHVAPVKVFLLYVQNMLSSAFCNSSGLSIVSLDPVHFVLEVLKVQTDRNIVFPGPGKDGGDVLESMDLEYHRGITQQRREPSGIGISVNIQNYFVLCTLHHRHVLGSSIRFFHIFLQSRIANKIITSKFSITVLI